MTTDLIQAIQEDLTESKENRLNFHPIEDFVLPSLNVCTEELLYFRHNEKMIYDYASKSFSLYKGGKLVFDTYFNSFSVGKFKRYTGLESLYFIFKGKGVFKIWFRLNRPGHSSRLLHEITIDLLEYGIKEIYLPFFNDLCEGTLFPVIKCLSAYGEINELAYATTNAPLNRVKLGIVVTHFKREHYVIPAIQRLRAGLLETDEYKDAIHLYVIDNSNTLTPGQTKGATLIPNKNYGGSGGFTKGLLHLMEEQTYTHCLFMDDDASCEIESIRRTYSFLQYTKEDTLCIAGALLLENFQYLQHESGASYSGGIVRPLKMNVDLRDPLQVMLNETEEKVDYGAWWFFAFPIRQIKSLSFPFFVRGDDITFSIQNQLQIITLNGVCTWGEDFTHKISAMERYLTMRSTLQMAILNNPSAESKKATVGFFARQVLHDLKTCNYDRAAMMCEAMDDVLKGKKFWLQNVNMDARRKELSGLILNEKNQVNHEVFKLTSGIYGIRESFIRKAIRRASLNGHLIPGFLLKKGTYRLNRYDENSPEHTFRKQAVFYYDPFTHQGYYTTHSMKRFFQLLLQFIKGYVAYSRAFSSLVDQFKKAKQEYMSVQFWQNQFRK